MLQKNAIKRQARGGRSPRGSPGLTRYNGPFSLGYLLIFDTETYNRYMQAFQHCVSVVIMFKSYLWPTFGYKTLPLWSSGELESLCWLLEAPRRSLSLRRVRHIDKRALNLILLTFKLSVNDRHNGPGPLLSLLEPSPYHYRGWISLRFNFTLQVSTSVQPYRRSYPPRII